MTTDRTAAPLRPATTDRPAARAASQPREHAPQPQENPAAEAPSQVPFVLTVAAPQDVATPAATHTRRGAVAASARVVAPAAPAFPIAPPASVAPGARAASASARP